MDSGPSKILNRSLKVTHTQFYRNKFLFDTFDSVFFFTEYPSTKLEIWLFSRTGEGSYYCCFVKNITSCLNRYKRSSSVLSRIDLFIV